MFIHNKERKDISQNLVSATRKIVHPTTVALNFICWEKLWFQYFLSSYSLKVRAISDKMQILILPQAPQLRKWLTLLLFDLLHDASWAKFWCFGKMGQPVLVTKETILRHLYRDVVFCFSRLTWGKNETAAPTNEMMYIDTHIHGCLFIIKKQK